MEPELAPEPPQPPHHTTSSQLLNATGDTVANQIVSAFLEIIYSPLNLALLAASFYLIFKIYQDKTRKPEPAPPTRPTLPKLPKRDYTPQELLPFDGTGPEGRILIAINGKVFDVTRGKGFYGPGGAYSIFAGRDASRGLATFALDSSAVKDTYDDLTDLSTSQMDTVKDWEQQFQDKYALVGRLLRPGEKPTDYAVEDEDTSTPKTSTDNLTKMAKN